MLHRRSYHRKNFNLIVIKWNLLKVFIIMIWKCAISAAFHIKAIRFCYFVSPVHMVLRFVHFIQFLYPLRLFHCSSIISVRDYYYYHHHIGIEYENIRSHTPRHQNMPINILAYKKRVNSHKPNIICDRHTIHIYVYYLEQCMIQFV